jgi:hypothetical protein
MNPAASGAARLAYLTVALGLALGGAALGLSGGSIVLAGFGAACLLQAPSAWNVARRIQEGLNNQGLERERLIHRGLGIALRLLALGWAAVAGINLLRDTATQTTDLQLGVAVLAFLLTAALAWAKRGLREAHPTLALDAARSRVLAELAALLLAGSLLGRWFPWAEAVTGLALAMRLFLEGRSLAKGSTLPAAACGGCGSGCGCG